MALELVGGGVLRFVFNQFLEEIRKVKDNVVMFKPKLEELEETLTVLNPVIEEIEELSRRLNRPRETIMLRRLLEDGTKLVSECSKVSRWDFFKQSCYKVMLVELDNKLLRFHNLYLQAHMGRDQKQTLLFVQETRQMMIMFLNQQGFSNLTLAITASPSTDSSTPASSTGSSNITVGITASTDSSDLTPASSMGSSYITTLFAASTDSSKILMDVGMRRPPARFGIALNGKHAFNHLQMGKHAFVRRPVVVKEDMEKLTVTGPVDAFDLQNYYLRTRGARPRFTCTLVEGIDQTCFMYK